jgi:hypothetical protein
LLLPSHHHHYQQATCHRQIKNCAEGRFTQLWSGFTHGLTML